MIWQGDFGKGVPTGSGVWSDPGVNPCLVYGPVPAAGISDNGIAFPSQRLGEPKRVGDAIALFLAQLHGAPALDVKRGPRPMQPVGEPLGVTNQSGAARVFADADQNAFTRRPGPGDGMRLHLAEQLLVNAFGRPAQRQFP